MASQYTILHNYAEPFTPYNADFIVQALSAKQQQYDAGKAKIEGDLAEILSFDLARGVDREYLYDRAQTLVDDINRFHKLDLSNSSIQSVLSSNISSIIDENVLNAVESTQNLRKYQSEVEYYKKNDPEKYNQINEAFGLKFFDNWFNDPEVGKRQGAVAYTPYYDIKGKFNEGVAELSKYYKPVKRVEYDGKGGAYEVVTSGIPEHVLRSYTSQFWNENALQQSRINGWHLAQVNPGLTSNQTATTLIDARRKQYKTYRDSLDAELAGGVTDDRKAAITRAKEEIDNEEKKYNNQVLSFFGGEENSNAPLDPVTVGQFIGMQSMEDYAVQTFGQYVTSYERKKDEVYWAIYDAKRQEYKDLADMQYKNDMLNIRRMEAEGKASGSSSSSRSGGVANPNSRYLLDQVLSTDGIAYNTEEFNVEDYFSKIYNNANAEISSLLDKLYNEADAGYRNAGVAWASSQMVNDPSLRGLNEKELFYRYLASSVGKGVHNKSIKNTKDLGETYLTIGTLYEEQDQRNTAYQSIARDYVQHVNNSTDALIDLATRENLPVAVVDNSGQFRLLDAREAIASSQDPSSVLIPSASAEKIASEALVSNYIGNYTRPFYANDKDFDDFYDKESYDNALKRNNGVTYGVGYVINGKIATVENQELLANASEKLGEGRAKIEDVFIANGDGTFKFRENSSNFPQTLQVFKGMFMSRVSENTKSSRGNEWSKRDDALRYYWDRHWTDDSAFNTVFYNRALDTLKNEKLLDAIGNVEGNRTWTVYKDDKDENANYRKILALYNTYGQVQYKDKHVDLTEPAVTTFRVTYNPAEDAIEIDPGTSLNEDFNKGRGIVRVASADAISMDILNPELIRMPYRQSPDNFKPKFFEIPNPDLNTDVGLDRKYRAMNIPTAFSNSTNLIIQAKSSNTVSSLLLDEQGSTSYGHVFDYVAKNASDLFTVSITPYVGYGESFFNANLIDKSTGDIIMTIPLQDVTYYEEIKRSMDYAPQVYANTAIYTMFEVEASAQVLANKGKLGVPITEPIKNIVNIVNKRLKNTQDGRISQ